MLFIEVNGYNAVIEDILHNGKLSLLYSSLLQQINLTLLKMSMH